MQEVLAMSYTTERATVHIYRPILTEEERAKRMQDIHDAACRLAIANMRLEEKQRQNHVE